MQERQTACSLISQELYVVFFFFGLLQETNVESKE